ncbi:Multimeric flavodoxin WrbA [Candidatus Methanophagaceae archaeon]|nr:Multimeric flavodoxin WrbA [Methanophagales archaeon]
MKILAIMGSPRKGDSYKLTQLIETKLKHLGEVELKYILLKEVNLGYCRGCSVCMKKGEQFCPLEDDALMIREEMLNADGLILVSPVYVHQVTAVMKIFIDRFAYALHRPCFLDKSAIIISTTELSGLEDVLDYLEFNARLWGFHVVHKLGVIAPAFKQAPGYRNTRLKEIEETAKKFFDALETKKRPSPDMYDLKHFNALKIKVKLHQKQYPCDYSYWQKNGWLDKDYFFDTHINVLKHFFVWVIVKRIERMIRKNFT